MSPGALIFGTTWGRFGKPTGQQRASSDPVTISFTEAGAVAKRRPSRRLEADAGFSFIDLNGHEIMFYCTCDPNHQGDRIRLYRDVESAIAADHECRPVYEVALCLEADDSLVVSSEIAALDFDPYWTTRAQLHGDGSITAKGMIPRELFVGSIYSPQCLARIQEARQTECA